jgi:CHRD domain-containing protein
MKRLAFLIAVLALAGTALTTALAGTAAKKSICHRTSSSTKPYVKLSVSATSLAAHLKHPADIYPVPKAGCPKTLLATTGGVAFDITLTGEAETPAGDPVGNGTATVRLRLGQAQACYKVAAKNLPASVGAHIHSGAAGTAGPVVIPFATPGADGTASGCAAAPRSLVAAILKDPGSYYVNVHTSEFPAGAIRGQLTGTNPASVGTIYAITLNGSTEPNATGTAVVRLLKDSGLVCYRLHAANVTLPTVAAHIHRGGAGVNGPVVVPFAAPGADGNSSGCTTSTPALVTEITGNPAGFYVNVHTREHPAGAIRNQLG